MQPMTIFFSVLFSSVCLGVVFGAYCQLYYLIQTVLLSWKLLSRHAIAKRQALLSLAVLEVTLRHVYLKKSIFLLNIIIFHGGSF